MTIDEFLLAFPEFIEFPTLQITLRLETAAEMFQHIDSETMKKYCVGLYTAHFLSIRGNNTVPGSDSGSGIVSSQSVDGVSVSYDTSSTMIQDAGFWNASRYGQELYWLMRQAGAGGYQL